MIRETWVLNSSNPKNSGLRKSSGFSIHLLLLSYRVSSMQRLNYANNKHANDIDI